MLCLPGRQVVGLTWLAEPKGALTAARTAERLADTIGVLHGCLHATCWAEDAAIIVALLDCKAPRAAAEKGAHHTFDG